MERRPWTRRLNRRLPLRFRDVLPQPLPPASLAESITPPNFQTPPTPTDQVHGDTCPSLAAQVKSTLYRIFTTPKNTFGLSRRYYAKEMPSYDPEEHISLQDLSTVPAQTDTLHSTSEKFYPYPNHHAFRLGYWFWNGGVQKSQQSFRELIDIIGDPEFQPSAVQDVRWDEINKSLADDDKECEWLDEDAGWTRTPVAISVPYQLHRGLSSEPHPGPRNYAVGNFYYRSLVSVIREKILNLRDAHLFHFEPYELIWLSAGHQTSIQVQGELYTSPAFVDAHRELQDSPGEPGCDLPRVIVALMFWSDVTHLTAFGNAKLWPLYVFFGNDSKYRRSKPTCRTCEHIAYFETVCFLHTSCHLWSNSPNSSRIAS